jgi:hypothetical protein
MLGQCGVATCVNLIVLSDSEQVLTQMAIYVKRGVSHQLFMTSLQYTIRH